MADDIALGKRVLVPFGRQHLTGVVVGLPERTEVRGLKPIRDVLDAVPTFPAEMLHLTKWMSEYYFAPWGEVLRAATPQGLAREGRRVVHLANGPDDETLNGLKKRAPKQWAIIDHLRAKEQATVAQLQERTNARSIHAALHTLQRQGWIRVEETITDPTAKPKTERAVELTGAGRTALVAGGSGLKERQRALLSELASSTGPESILPMLKRAGVSSSTLQTLVRKGLVRTVIREAARRSPYDAIETPPNITLNPDQVRVLEAVTVAVNGRAYRTFLLHGVTGSGKTQVYIETIRAALALGKTAIVLVPEIALTPQTVRRFRSHFGNDVAVMHSQMSVGERYDAWRQARDGSVRIVIGPRSAVFAPLANIGLIVVDEEHEHSYKQFDAAPRYNARDVAVVRAMHANAAVVLGSATPSMESYYNAVAGKYELLELPQRVDDARMPAIEIVDITQERRRQFEEIRDEIRQKGGEFPKRLPDRSISRALAVQIEARLAKKEGIILLQNRRGFSHVVECYDCGHVERCDNCDVSLTFHQTKKHLRCHYCGIVRPVPTSCPHCHSAEIRLHAFGTQQVEEELQRLFPTAVILRMDRDTTSGKGAHDRILTKFGSGEADILLGTQMVAKGLDFPRVTLVGVISADTQMLLPDFRASEATFQLLTQVAGRAGRSVLAGEVVIQTLQPGHYSLRHVVGHNYRGFYDEEIGHRKELDYPPFSRLVLVEFSGSDEAEVMRHAKRFADAIGPKQTHGALTILGPADAAIPKLRNLYRKHVVIKNLKTGDPGGNILRAALTRASSDYEKSNPAGRSGVRMTIDVDPQGMM